MAKAKRVCVRKGRSKSGRKVCKKFAPAHKAKKSKRK